MNRAEPAKGNGSPVGIITGAASGIGAATAEEFARLGARLVLGVRRGENPDPTLELVKRNGGQAVAVESDVRLPGDAARLVAAALSAFGSIDLLFANAGVADQSSISDGDPWKWREILETNLLGAALCVRAVVPHMLEQRSGHIILTASVSGRETYVGEPLYIASKWGLVGLGHALRKELSSAGVRVSLIEPGLVDTPLTRNNPVVQPLLDACVPLLPSDVARSVVFVYEQPKHVLISEMTIRPLWQPELASTVLVPRSGGASDA